MALPLTGHTAVIGSGQTGVGGCTDEEGDVAGPERLDGNGAGAMRALLSPIVKGLNAAEFVAEDVPADGVEEDPPFTQRVE